MLKTNNVHMFLPLVLSVFFLSCLCSCQEIDTITSTSFLRDPDTIESAARTTFRFGFFSPPNSTYRYLGIFYAFSEETVVWVANRDRPLNDSSGIVTIAGNGNLVLRNGRNEVLWSTNVTNSSLSNRNAQLQDTGNLVLMETATSTVLWESFSEPTDVHLPVMRLIRNIHTGANVFLSSWKDPSDPGVGNFTYGLDVQHDLVQSNVWQNGRLYMRSGPWNGQIFIGSREMYYLDRDGLSMANDNGTFYFTVPLTPYFLTNTLSSTGNLVTTTWNDQQRNWVVASSYPENQCDIYGTCGAFGICNHINSPICSCARGFEPVNREEWNRGNWTNGCVRRRALNCDQRNNPRGDGGGDGFVRVRFTKLPDFAEQYESRQANVCRSRCLENCSCIAYAHDPYLGCMFWSGSLIDTNIFNDVGEDLYIRVAASELGNPLRQRLIIIIPIVVGLSVILICSFIVGCLIVKRRGKNAKDRKFTDAGPMFLSNSTAIAIQNKTDNVNNEELPLFTFETLAIATDRFNETNLLGKGGFGLVYRGTLTNGKEIAVKRLSTASGQGNKEFMNEVVMISKLQHKNLVRLLGCCVERGEKMLIYEYMPNKSLDGCLFDPAHESRKILDWKKRLGIIEGIGRGLLYLHSDSRLKIIHRDLKPSNVLLDEDWNPKISDFGMARIFNGNEDHLSTARVVGTHGYMAPEYAMQGQYSEKSDVYSFGVLMLEVLSGKKSTHYYNPEFSLGLLATAWKLWNEKNALSFVDQEVPVEDFQRDIVRCVQTALLCVQEFPNDRPSMETVLSMLSHEILDLPVPVEPVYADWNCSEIGTVKPSSRFEHSTNELTLTVLDGR